MSESENIQRLRAIRGAHRGIATKLLKEADEILASTSTTTLDNGLKTKLNTLKQQIEGKLAKLNEVDEKILGLCDVKNIGAEVVESEEYTTKVTSCIVQLESVVNKCERNIERCFICLRTGHVSQECQNSRGCRKCGHRHHQSITLGNLPKPPEKPKETPEPLNQTRPGDPPETTTATNATGSSLKGKPVLLQTAQCVAANADTARSTTFRVLFDTGSQRTYITNSLKSQLGLKPIEKESLRLSTFGNDRVRKESCDIVKLSLRKGDGESVNIAALSFPVICSSLPLQVDVSAYPHIEGLPLADEFSGQEHDSIDVLIGSDQYWNFITGETVREDFGPAAVSSKLGWLLSGPISGATTNSVDTFTINLIISGESGRRISSVDDELKSTLKQFWETESIGIREPEDSSINQLSRSFLKNIKYEDSRYEVSLPWKEEKMDVPTDYNYCYNQLRSVVLARQLRTGSDVTTLMTHNRK